MVESLLTEGGRLVFGFGVLGVYSVLSTIAIVYLWRDSRAATERSHEQHAQFMAMAQTVVASNEANVRSRDDQGRILQGLADTISKQAAAFETMAKVDELQTQRLLERLAK